MIIYRMQQFWHEHGFNIMLGFSLIFLFVYWIIRRGTKGTYDQKPVIFGSPSISNVQPKRNYNFGGQDMGSSSQGRESKLEQACRQALREIFNRPFNKARPDFLRNPVTQHFNLELDCFDPELKIAVEANGRQHYEFTPYFHKNKEAFQNQLYRDELKRRMCKDNGITLVEVPYTIKEENVKDYILNKLRNFGVRI